MTPTRADLERLIETVRVKMAEPHAQCDDCWYSCPKSGECCNDREAKLDVCYCGKDAIDALLSDVLQVLNQLAALLTSDGPAPTCASCQHWMGQVGDTLAGCRQNVSAHSDYGANTPPDFGCTLHEPAEGPETPADTHISCECPAGRGNPCPLTPAECDARVRARTPADTP